MTFVGAADGCPPLLGGADGLGDWTVVLMGIVLMGIPPGRAGAGGGAVCWRWVRGEGCVAQQMLLSSPCDGGDALSSPVGDAAGWPKPWRISYHC